MRWTRWCRSGRATPGMVPTRFGSARRLGRAGERIVHMFSTRICFVSVMYLRVPARTGEDCLVPGDVEYPSDLWMLFRGCTLHMPRCALNVAAAPGSRNVPCSTEGEGRPHVQPPAYTIALATQLEAWFVRLNGRHVKLAAVAPLVHSVHTSCLPHTHIRHTTQQGKRAGTCRHRPTPAGTTKRRQKKIQVVVITTQVDAVSKDRCLPATSPPAGSTPSPC